MLHYVANFVCNLLLSSYILDLLKLFVLKIAGNRFTDSESKQ